MVVRNFIQMFVIQIPTLLANSSNLTFPANRLYLCLCTWITDTWMSATWLSSVHYSNVHYQDLVCISGGNETRSGYVQYFLVISVYFNKIVLQAHKHICRHSKTDGLCLKPYEASIYGVFSSNTWLTSLLVQTKKKHFLATFWRKILPFLAFGHEKL